LITLKSSTQWYPIKGRVSDDQAPDETRIPGGNQNRNVSSQRVTEQHRRVLNNLF